MSFGEDQSRIRRDNAPANIAVIRHAVLNAIANLILFVITNHLHDHCNKPSECIQG